MTGAELGLAISVFLACAVEAVEALTIVMAVGQTRDWRSALAGVGAAVVVLAALVAGLGSALLSLPVDELRLAIGVLLLAIGVQWLRKAVLRAAGIKAMHDEADIYRAQVAAARAAGSRFGALDRYTFAVSLKAVLLEGLEVALIVVTFGVNRHRLGLAAVAAGLAVAAVVGAGLAVRVPLARVPENTMKFAVGVMLCSFGVFWGAEGAGASWPGGDAFLLAIMPAVLGASVLAVLSLRRGALRRGALR
jgi:uncharacterized membrane protein